MVVLHLTILKGDVSRFKSMNIAWNNYTRQ